MNTLSLGVYKQGAASGRLPMNLFHVESPTFCAVRASFPGKKACPMATFPSPISYPTSSKARTSYLPQ